MTNCSRGCGRNNRPPAPRPPAPPSEPTVRRWPHPVGGTQPSAQTDPGLYYIRCALSYQNQLLSEIKTLLQQLTLQEEPAEE